MSMKNFLKKFTPYTNYKHYDKALTQDQDEVFSDSAASTARNSVIDRHDYVQDYLVPDQCSSSVDEGNGTDSSQDQGHFSPNNHHPPRQINQNQSFYTIGVQVRGQSKRSAQNSEREAAVEEVAPQIPLDSHHGCVMTVTRVSRNPRTLICLSPVESYSRVIHSSAVLRETCCVVHLLDVLYQAVCLNTSPSEKKLLEGVFVCHYICLLVLRSLSNTIIEDRECIIETENVLFDQKTRGSHVCWGVGPFQLHHRVCLQVVLFKPKEGRTRQVYKTCVFCFRKEK
eukprot:sb/3467786/